MTDYSSIAESGSPTDTTVVAPSIPLPWFVQESNSFQIVADSGQEILDRGDEFARPEDAAYAVHAANAYPRLVAALLECSRELFDHVYVTPGLPSGNQRCEPYAALLRELGELK